MRRSRASSMRFDMRAAKSSAASMGTAETSGRSENGRGCRPCNKKKGEKPVAGLTELLYTFSMNGKMSSQSRWSYETYEQSIWPKVQLKRSIKLSV